MQQFPISLNMIGQPVLVCGGGELALKKSAALDAAQAQIRIIAKKIDHSLKSRFPRARFEERTARLEDFQCARIAIIATGDQDEAERLYALSREARVLTNVVDMPHLCDWTMPAVIDRDAVTVAISTNGASPVLAQHIRRQVEALLPQGIGTFADFLKMLRPLVKKAQLAPTHSLKFWRSLVHGPVRRQVEIGQSNRALHRAKTLLHQMTKQDKVQMPKGTVTLVGAGPGDPDLLTLKALQAMSTADVIFHDRLVDPAVLNRCRRDAEFVDVGKQAGAKSASQQAIIDAMIVEANVGKQVVRLKGGDPFIFGRGGEEILALHNAGIGVDVVPGVTAALGCAASAGIPLSHRDFAQDVIFATAHVMGEFPERNWANYVGRGKTLVVYMGVSATQKLVANLIAHGANLLLPAAIIQDGTLANERVYRTTLAELAQTVEKYKVKSPALLILGDVVNATMAKNEEVRPMASCLGLAGLQLASRSENLIDAA